jgi:hypothetical protein
MSDGWEALNAAVAEARALIAAEAPDAAVAAEGEAYVTRVLAAALGSAVLGHLFVEDGLSRALPTYGGPNPHYVMRHAAIDPAGSYRLKGRLNGSERVGVGLYRPGANGGTPIEVGYVAFEPGDCDARGGFALDLSAGAGRPRGLAIPPEARILLIRILHRDPAAEPARLRLSGGAPARDLALMTGSPQGALGVVAFMLRSNVRQYLQWTAAVLRHPNRFESAPPELAEGVQGDPDTQYFLGGFDLAEDEWLAVTMPADLSGYWSVHAYNYWFEHLQTPGVHDRNARADPGGRVRIAIGPAPPKDAANRIDTLGRRRGALICRIIGAGGFPSAHPQTGSLRA